MKRFYMSTILLMWVSIVLIVVAGCAGMHPLMDAESYVRRGLAYEKRGQNHKAISDYDKAIEINPRYAEAHNNRGVAYHNKGQYDKAISDYNQAIEINPRYAGAYRNLGIAYRTKGQYNDAISDYDKAIEINPRYYKAYFNKATTCERAGHTREAIEAYIGLIMYAPSKYRGSIKHARERIKELDRKLPQKLKLASRRSLENVQHNDCARILGD
jgi:tetratricopeptide (TPR) repeat protein